MIVVGTQILAGPAPRATMNQAGASVVVGVMVVMVLMVGAVGVVAATAWAVTVTFGDMVVAVGITAAAGAAVVVAVTVVPVRLLGWPTLTQYGPCLFQGRPHRHLGRDPTVLPHAGALLWCCSTHLTFLLTNKGGPSFWHPSGWRRMRPSAGRDNAVLPRRCSGTPRPPGREL